MSDSETDPDLTVSRYDEEDDLNYYGSPVYREEGERTAVEIAATATNDVAPSTSDNDRTQFCSCKNTCSKKSGRKQRGCPCRDESLQCTLKCTCGTKKASCKNKQSDHHMADKNVGKNAFERHEIAVQEAKQQITGFIANLNEEQKDKLLLEILSNGKGSLDYAKNLLQFGDPPPIAPSIRPPWCKCGVCRPMPTEEENKCCQKVRCTTSYVTFMNTCLDRDVLIMAIRGRSDLRAEEPDYSTNSFRKAAYRQYILWRYKKLGKGNRKVCPSCVVLAVRQVYPADDGLYMGFKRA